ncbi:hypothetical protein AB205_0085660, partial [Aquarana catesbeiana]
MSTSASAVRDSPSDWLRHKLNSKSVSQSGERGAELNQGSMSEWTQGAVTQPRCPHSKLFAVGCTQQEGGARRAEEGPKKRRIWAALCKTNCTEGITQKWKNCRIQTSQSALLYLHVLIIQGVPKGDRQNKGTYDTGVTGYLKTGKMNNSNVKVAVRVRPLNQREEGINSECVVRVSGNQITLLPPISCKEKARKEPHTFTYDNCFWTEDRHDTGQEDVFEHLGDGVLQNIWLGYNVCMFAYGQTGSGKTFSMMGTEDQPGIVPKICSALFNKESNDLETIRIEASYFEIYNEKVRDLLRSEEKQGKLRVREDRLLGPYVEELSCHAVQSYEEIKLMLDQGNKQRAIAETKMNEQSSRSHSILTLTVTQICNDPKSGASRELVSKVSLVDLAGSERSYKSGAKGSQLKECCNINKSLLTLGLVINSLAKISENKMKSQHVKYRNSVLTWLLKNNLGGNSKTIMLATVSPAADNYQETLSTLRYAESTKRIVNQAMVNKDVKSKAIEKLQEEIKKLREQLTTTEHVKEAEVQKLKSQLEEKKNLLNVLETSWEEKLKRTEVATKEWQKNLENMGAILKKQNVTFSNECYLIQRDTSLIIHNINDITKIGSGPSQDIQISGPEAE